MLTVVIPSYNHEQYIAECLQAITRIRIIGLRVIVIDDGSVDKTAVIAKEFQQDNPNIDIDVIVNVNQGLINSLLQGLDIADTEYVYFCASDDVPQSDAIIELTTILERNLSLRFIIGGSKNLFNDSLANTYRRSHSTFFANDTTGLRKALFFDYPKPLLLQSTVFRVSALKRVGGWDKEVSIDDYSIFIKLFSFYDRSEYRYIADTTVVHYRIHGANSSKNISRQYEMMRQLFSYYAPQETLNKAIGYRLSFYVLSSARRFEFSLVFCLLRSSSWVQLFYALIYMPRLALKFITGGI